MKTLKNTLAFGKNNKISAVLSLLVLFLMAVGCGGTKPDLPSESVTESLVKASLADFADAVDKNDFKKLRDNSSDNLKATYTEEQMKTTFKTFVDQKDATVPILRSAGGMKAKFSAPPSIREEKGNYILVAQGNFETTPLKTRFDNEYVWSGGAWKLLKIGTYIER
jgi:hypothetical protein